MQMVAQKNVVNLSSNIILPLVFAFSFIFPLFDILLSPPSELPPPNGQKTLCALLSRRNLQARQYLSIGLHSRGFPDKIPPKKKLA